MKILVNGITFDEANLIPLLLNLKYWQKHGFKITFLGNRPFEKRIKKSGIISDFDFIYINGEGRLKDRASLIFEGIRRNLEALFLIGKIKGKFDIILSRSSVLDFIIFPWFLKKFDKKVKWATVFDNIVEFESYGARLVRFLAWAFFEISLPLLREADFIFVISQDLKAFLIKSGFNKEKIILTGNGVEVDLIKKATPLKRYKTDALFIGRINETKGIDDMLEVLSLIKVEYPNFRLTIMGEGDTSTEKKFKNKIKRKSLEKNIQFLGYKTGLTKFRIIKSSKIFLFLSKSKSESFGIALLEAVCCGLPAFAYNLKPYQAIYKKGEVNFFKIGDYPGVARAIINAFKEGKFTNPKGRRLLSKYSWDRIAEIQLRSFLEII